MGIAIRRVGTALGLAGALTVSAHEAEAQSSGVELLDEILVTTPARGPRALQQTPAAVGVVESEDIERRQAQTFEDLIGDAAGVTIEGGPRGISQEPNIRGFQDEQVVIRVDGARQNFNLAHRGRFFLDPDIVQRVEVVRGGASALYGSGGLGGVISVETKDAADLLAPGETVGGRVRGSYATNGGEYFGSGTLFGQLGSLDAIAFLGWREMTDDLEGGSEGEIRASEIDSKNALLKLGFEPTDALRVEANLQYYEDEGVTSPNANAEATAANEVNRDVTVGSYRLGFDYAPEASDLVNLKALVYFNTNDVEEDRISDGRLDETEYETIGLDFSNSSNLDIGAPVILTYGFEGYQDTQTGERDGAAREQFPDAEATYLAGFLQAEVEITEQLTIIPGLRYDHFELNPDSSAFDDRSEGELSPRVALSFEATENVTFWGSWSQSFRAPSLTELYNDGEHFSFTAGPNTFVNNFVPNPDLEPERASQFEIGLRTRFRNMADEGDRLTASANAYYADVEDYIETTVSSNYVFAGPGLFTGTTTKDNVDATLWGFEAELAYDAPRWFAGATLTIPRGETTDSDQLNSLPQARLSLNLGWRPIASDTAFEVGGRATLSDGQSGDAEDSVEETPGSSVFDVYAAYAPDSGPLQGARFQIGVDNVLDRGYRLHPVELEQPGRTVKITGAVQF
ncbi:MAG: TonB-dependent hemoglobin/transferrin/lactoferrin family receptor [Neomegalonema sp.]